MQRILLSASTAFCALLTCGAAMAQSESGVGVPEIEATLPRDLSPWGMFLGADIVVKAVIVGLLFASFLTWTIFLAKFWELSAARRRTAKANAVLAAARSLDEAHAKLPRKAVCKTVHGLVAAATQEAAVSGDLPADGVKERAAISLSRIEVKAAAAMNRGTGLLATIGATAPFVGLFGTVWGIMNSFIGISQAHTTNLAVVAPGIAEALLATALGLFAAIPAVVIYNVFARSIGRYRQMLADASAETLRLLSRDLDRKSQAGPRVRGIRAAAAE